ncbi:MAG: RidA family protein [Alphaproteobacteria bacterium]|nr:MAG: RidA family protein [Alphaproteobacteria bacterium]
MKHITPAGIRPPFARYSYGVEIPPGSRILVCSGQLGITPIAQDLNADGALGDASAASAEKGRLTAEHQADAFIAFLRDVYIADPPPASTLMIVSGFARPEFLVEVEIIAAAP